MLCPIRFSLVLVQKHGSGLYVYVFLVLVRALLHALYDLSNTVYEYVCLRAFKCFAQSSTSRVLVSVLYELLYVF